VIFTQSTVKAEQMTKEELERLVRAYEEELDYYRSLFSVDQFTARLRDYFGLTEQLAAALKLFLDTGRVSNEALTKTAEVFGRKGEHEKDYSKIMIWRLRKALEDFGVNIENSYGWGYQISPDTLKEIKDVVNGKKKAKKSK
jgi:hypothetical protein